MRECGVIIYASSLSTLHKRERGAREEGVRVHYSQTTRQWQATDRATLNVATLMAAVCPFSCRSIAAVATSRTLTVLPSPHTRRRPSPRNRPEDAVPWKRRRVRLGVRVLPEYITICLLDVAAMSWGPSGLILTQVMGPKFFWRTGFLKDFQYLSSAVSCNCGRAALTASIRLKLVIWPIR